MSSPDLPAPSRVPTGQHLRFAHAVARHFHEDGTDEDVAPYARAAEADHRGWWVADDDRVMGNLGVIETDISLPGGARVPVAAITAVGVGQTYRRRGLLRALMTAALTEAAERGEPLAALYATESAIYGRFGFGAAAPQRAYRADRSRVSFRDPVDVRIVEEVTADHARANWPSIHTALGDGRPGSVAPSAGLWDLELVEDPPSSRDGATPRRLVEVPGRGYAAYRVRPFDAVIPDGEVRLSTLVATDPEAWSALWQHVLDVDLTARLVTWVRPPDDPVLHLVSDPHALHPSDGPPLYVRVLDVPRVLSTRGYGPGTLEVVLEVVDRDGFADGRYALRIADTTASCEPTTAAPDLRLDAEVLARLVLGGVELTALVAAGRLEAVTPAVVEPLSVMLRSSRAPWTTMIF